ncbi:MAG: hypothetical protein ACRD0G_11380 [Acidimicrobiales bacterium]
MSVTTLAGDTTGTAATTRQPLGRRGLGLRILARLAAAGSGLWLWAATMSDESLTYEGRATWFFATGSALLLAWPVATVLRLARRDATAWMGAAWIDRVSFAAPLGLLAGDLVRHGDDPGPAALRAAVATVAIVAVAVSASAWRARHPLPAQTPAEVLDGFHDGAVLYALNPVIVFVPTYVMLHDFGARGPIFQLADTVAEGLSGVGPLGQIAAGLALGAGAAWFLVRVGFRAVSAVIRGWNVRLVVFGVGVAVAAVVPVLALVAPVGWKQNTRTAGFYDELVELRTHAGLTGAAALAGLVLASSALHRSSTSACPSEAVA